MGDGRRASASAGRRTDEEERAPGADGGAFLDVRRGRADGDENDEGGGYRNRNNGVEDNAQGAVVASVSREWVCATWTTAKRASRTRQRMLAATLEREGWTTDLLRVCLNFVGVSPR